MSFPASVTDAGPYDESGRGGPTIGPPSFSQGHAAARTGYDVLQPANHRSGTVWFVSLGDISLAAVDPLERDFVVKLLPVVGAGLLEVKATLTAPRRCVWVTSGSGLTASLGASLLTIRSLLLRSTPKGTCGRGLPKILLVGSVVPKGIRLLRLPDLPWDIHGQADVVRVGPAGPVPALHFQLHLLPALGKVEDIGENITVEGEVAIHVGRVRAVLLLGRKQRPAIRELPLRLVWLALTRISCAAAAIELSVHHLIVSLLVPHGSLRTPDRSLCSDQVRSVPTIDASLQAPKNTWLLGLGCQHC